MIRNVLQAMSGIEIYPVISLMIFFTLFMSVLIWFFKVEKSHLRLVTYKLTYCKISFFLSTIIDIFRSDKNAIQCGKLYIYIAIFKPGDIALFCSNLIGELLKIF